MANGFGAPIAVVAKKRVAIDQSQALALEGDVAGKTVVLVDDIINTGVTAVEAAKKALANGAACVVACFTHPVLSEGAVALLEKSPIEKVWVGDTIRLDGIDLGKKISVVSIKKMVDDFPPFVAGNGEIPNVSPGQGFKFHINIVG